MPKLGTADINGASGKSYAFTRYPKGTLFNDFIPVVYCLSKRHVTANGTVEETAVYVGESDNVRVDLERHLKEGKFDEHGYNTVSFCRNANVEKRRAIQQDLIEALAPIAVD